VLLRVMGPGSVMVRAMMAALALTLMALVSLASLIHDLP
jgi:hypothetical protein